MKILGIGLNKTGMFYDGIFCLKMELSFGQRIHGKADLLNICNVR